MDGDLNIALARSLQGSRELAPDVQGGRVHDGDRGDVPVADDAACET